MKVIFLDIDGVLNTSKTFKDNYKYYKETGIRRINIDEHRVKILSEIVNKTEAKIVISGTLRIHLFKGNNGFITVNQHTQELLDLFDEYGIKIYDITSIDKDRIRQNEINTYLSLNEVEEFIIIDDDSQDLTDFIDNELIKPNYFEKDGKAGLCEEHIDIIVNKLNNKKLIKKL